MNKEQARAIRPLLILFVLVTVIGLAGRPWLVKNGISAELVLGGNLILFVVNALAWYINIRSLRSKSPQAPVRGMYGGFMIKFFLIALAAFIYIMMAKKEVNKPGLMILAGLYILYAGFETRALLQTTRKKQDA